MSKTTQHGANVASQIQERDVYGCSNKLTLADVWLIIDNLHTHFLDTERGTEFLSRWMRELEDMDKDLPAI